MSTVKLHRSICSPEPLNGVLPANTTTLARIELRIDSSTSGGNGGGATALSPRMPIEASAESCTAW